MSRLNESASSISTNNKDVKNENPAEDPLHIFDLLNLTDTRIPELSARAGQPSPYLILQVREKMFKTQL